MAGPDGAADVWKSESIGDHVSTVDLGTPARGFAEPSPTAAALLLLGRGSDPHSERGVACWPRDCSGEI